ncbi:MAG TPA: hypothetical protein DIU15_06350 [Deltaproteobacteria bacterium]|nr:hypothetical protein [Deltaproteobacteria bacterium]HCP45641.1 hypothetical protein [Deltaproteobacteria bacterium]
MILFVVASAVWLMLLGTALAVLVALASSGSAGSGFMESALGLSVFTVMQSLGMLGIIVGICRIWDRPLMSTLGLGPMPRHLPLVAGCSGLAASLLSGWVAEVVTQSWSWFEAEHLTVLAELLIDGPLPGRLALLAMVLLVAPLAEEVIFRGFLWKGIEEATSPTIAWLATSLLFAAYHVDPLHVVSILPTGLFLGWLRRTSQSIRPAILCHFSHNLLGVSLCLWGGSEVEVPMSLLAFSAVAGVLLISGICAHRLGSVQFSHPSSAQLSPEASVQE